MNLRLRGLGVLLFVFFPLVGACASDDEVGGDFCGEIEAYLVSTQGLDIGSFHGSTDGSEVDLPEDPEALSDAADEAVALAEDAPPEVADYLVSYADFLDGIANASEEEFVELMFENLALAEEQESFAASLAEDCDVGALTGDTVGTGGDDDEPGGDTVAFADLDDPGPVDGFVVVELEEDEIKALVPEGWEEDGIFDGYFEPVGGDINTQLRYLGTCQGLCEVKTADEWREVGEEFITDLSEIYDAVSDEDREEGRVLRFEGTGFFDDPVVVLHVQRWLDDQDQFLVCEMTLVNEDIDEDLLSRAEDACFSTTATFL